MMRLEWLDSGYQIKRENQERLTNQPTKVRTEIRQTRFAKWIFESKIDCHFFWDGFCSASRSLKLTLFVLNRFVWTVDSVICLLRGGVGGGGGVPCFLPVLLFCTVSHKVLLLSAS